MKWNEMKWNEMKWNEMKWNEMIWNEMKWRDRKLVWVHNWSEEKRKIEYGYVRCVRVQRSIILLCVSHELRISVTVWYHWKLRREAAAWSAHIHTHTHTHTTQRLTLSATSMLALFSKRSAIIAVCPNVATIRRGVMTNCEVSYKLNINTLGKILLEGTLNVIIKMGIRHSVAFNLIH